MLWTIFNGFCMACSDSVPGVSGGTIAFILGFYERLLNSVHGLFRGKGKVRVDSLKYLIKLGCGWLVGMLVAMTLLANVLDSSIYVLCSAFIGLTVAAIPFIIHEEKDCMKGRWGFIAFTVLGAAIVVCITLLRQSLGTMTIDFSNMQGLQYLYVFVAGMVAISAMILPGISGSTLLLIFGVYAPAVMAIHQILTLDMSPILAVVALVAGGLVGLALAIGLVRRAIERHRGLMLYLIVGLMIGSLFAIVMGPTTLSTAQAALSLSTFNIPAMLAGIAVLVGLEALKKFVEKRGRSGAPRLEARSDPAVGYKPAHSRDNRDSE